jgi:hypothetical protein
METPIKILHPHHINCQEIIDSKDKTKIFGKSKPIYRSGVISFNNMEDILHEFKRANLANLIFHRLHIN